jgi:hypothetical protein
VGRSLDKFVLTANFKRSDMLAVPLWCQTPLNRQNQIKIVHLTHPVTCRLCNYCYSLYLELEWTIFLDGSTARNENPNPRDAADSVAIASQTWAVA